MSQRRDRKAAPGLDAGTGPARQRGFAPTLGEDADRLEVRELARFDDAHTGPARTELAEHHLCHLLRECLQQFDAMGDRQSQQATAQGAVVDRVADVIAAARANPWQARVDIDDQRLRVASLIDVTLLTATDLPWQADGAQPDGPHVRAPVDALVRAALQRSGERRMASSPVRVAPVTALCTTACAAC